MGIFNSKPISAAQFIAQQNGAKAHASPLKKHPTQKIISKETSIEVIPERLLRVITAKAETQYMLPSEFAAFLARGQNGHIILRGNLSLTSLAAVDIAIIHDGIKNKNPRLIVDGNLIIADTAAPDDKLDLSFVCLNKEAGKPVRHILLRGEVGFDHIIVHKHVYYKKLPFGLNGHSIRISSQKIDVEVSHDARRQNKSLRPHEWTKNIQLSTVA